MCCFILGRVCPLVNGGELISWGVRSPYMLNTRNEEKNTVFYSCLACFVNTVTLKYVRVPVIYRVNQARYVIYILVVAPQEYVNIYSTSRVCAHLGVSASCSACRIAVSF